jgi:hypothetical protein
MDDPEANPNGADPMEAHTPESAGPEQSPDAARLVSELSVSIRLEMAQLSTRFEDQLAISTHRWSETLRHELDGRRSRSTSSVHSDAEAIIRRKAARHKRREAEKAALLEQARLAALAYQEFRADRTRTSTPGAR